MLRLKSIPLEEGEDEGFGKKSAEGKEELLSPTLQVRTAQITFYSFTILFLVAPSRRCQHHSAIFGARRIGGTLSGIRHGTGAHNGLHPITCTKLTVLLAKPERQVNIQDFAAHFLLHQLFFFIGMFCSIITPTPTFLCPMSSWSVTYPGAWSMPRCGALPEMPS